MLCNNVNFDLPQAAVTFHTKKTIIPSLPPSSLPPSLPACVTWPKLNPNYYLLLKHLSSASQDLRSMSWNLLTPPLSRPYMVWLLFNICRLSLSTSRHNYRGNISLDISKSLEVVLSDISLLARSFTTELSCLQYYQFLSPPARQWDTMCCQTLKIHIIKPSQYYQTYLNAAINFCWR